MKEVYGIVYLTARYNERGVAVKFYVGQHNRRSRKNYLGSGKLLMRAIRKYGRTCFSRITLEECYSQEELSAAEIKWISRFNAVNDPIFYNILPGGDFPPESEKKEVHQYTLSGEYVASYGSLVYAADAVGSTPPLIGNAAVQRRSKHTAAGFQWRLEKFDSIPPRRERQREKPSHLKTKVSCYDFGGKYVRTFDSIKEAAKFHNVRVGNNISQCCQFKRLTSCGLQWRYGESMYSIEPYVQILGRNKFVIKLNPFTYEHLEEFVSAKAASVAMGVCTQSMSDALLGGTCCGGFKWMYKGGEYPRKTTIRPETLRKIK